jgi:hypothetical protein
MLVTIDCKGFARDTWVRLKEKEIKEKVYTRFPIPLSWGYKSFNLNVYRNAYLVSIRNVVTMYTVGPDKRRIYVDLWVLNVLNCL